MEDLTSKTFVLSHSVNGGYDFTGNIDILIPDVPTQKWVKSYISMLTEYASDPNYISIPVTTKSYFTTDGNVIFVDSYPQRDSRMFLESKITIESKSDNIDFEKRYSPSKKEFNETEGDSFLNKLLKVLLTAFVSDHTVFYCVVDKDSDIEFTRNAITDFSQEILKQNTCIEVIGKIPSVKTSAVICRCILPQDKACFLNEIKTRSNYVLVDFTLEKPAIEVCINTPSYAQQCLTHLFSKYNFENIYYSLQEIKFCRAALTPKNAFFNALCFLMMLKNFRNDISVVPATLKEKEEINSLLKEVDVF